MKKYTMVVPGAVFLLMAAGLAVATSSASAAGDKCYQTVVDAAASTETIQHPAVTRTEEVMTAPGQEYIAPTEATVDLWWNWSPNDTKGPQDYEPAFPADSRGTWQGPHANGGPMQDTYGTFQTSTPGNSNWFHREAGTPADPGQEYIAPTFETVTVIVKEAFTESIKHPAVTHQERVPCNNPPEVEGEQETLPSNPPEVAGEQETLPNNPPKIEGQLETPRNSLPAVAAVQQRAPGPRIPNQRATPAIQVPTMVDAGL